ncbi:uncharacterized protein Tco025E_01096 [Trypanosoma conorhini]|uniref:Uncharacterized protein n=1 Tax=Trypanosoma conorhini TaxID=83891 RepID=A0A3R7LG77_9TRYP|nr:uncharacterized protein Tco025E_01096 [Trypanosoma conorhini]RNF26698.1 hypothetical protein Tco025E_01096 [Trypanosoma conorhini]
MQANLPPPPLVSITFSGQPALSTGVVNLRALLGSAEYVLVGTVQARTRAGRAATADAAEDPDDAYTEEEAEDASSGEHSGRPAGSARRRLQLCEHAGLPLGCFFVEAGGSYEVVRRDDIQWGSLSGVPRGRGAAAAVAAEAMEPPKAYADRGAEAGEARKKHRREGKRQKREERAEKAEKEKKSKRERHRKERRAAVAAAVTAAAAAGAPDTGKDGDNGGSSDGSARGGNEQAGAGKGAQPGAGAEKTTGDYAADSARAAMQRVHLETPPSPTLPEPEPGPEKAKENKTAGASRRKTVSPPPLDAQEPAPVPRRRQRPLDSLSSSPSRERDNGQQQKPPVGEAVAEAEEQKVTGRKRKGAKGRTRCDSGVAAETSEGAASPFHSHALAANTHVGPHLSGVVDAAASESASAAAPANATATASVTNGVEGIRKEESPLQKGLETATIEADEEQEEEVTNADGRVSAYMLRNGWTPQESPALGFTSVDNTLSQDFSLDSSSIASSADYVY